MILTLVTLLLIVLMFTDFGGVAATLVAVGFLSFFFLSLLRLLDVISTPFKVGVVRTDDDVSLFLLHEFVVQAQAAEAGTWSWTTSKPSRRGRGAACRDRGAGG